MPSFPLEPSAAGAEPAGLQPGEFVARALPERIEKRVDDQLAATTGEDRRTAGETCPLLLALAGWRTSDATALWEYAAADRGAVASGGIAEAGAGEIDPESSGDGEVSDQTGQEGGGQQLRGLATGHPGPCATPWTRAKENIYALESLNRYTVSGSGEAKTEIPAQVATGLGPEGAK